MISHVFQEVDGVFLCKLFPEDAVRSTLQYMPRPGDVFIVSYPKCGTTWMQHVVYNIFIDAMPPKDKSDFFLRMPFLERQGAEAAIHGPKPGAFKTHLQFGKNPYSPDAKYIYITRNPYDCCVSFYYHTKHIQSYEFGDGTFDQFFEMFMKGKVDFGDYFDHLLSWYEHRNDSNVLFLTYESLKKDTKSWVLKIADFLGPEYGEKLRRDVGLLNKVIEMSSAKHMKEHMNAIRRVPWKQVSDSFNLDKINPELRKGLDTLSIVWEKPMTGDFVRKAVVGDWKNHFSQEQIRRLKERIRDRTKGSDVMDLWKDEDLP